MNAYLAKWAGDLISGESRRLPKAFRVQGVREAHLGPRLEVARVELLAEPADDLNVVFDTSGLAPRPELPPFVESAVFGFLDVVLLAEPYPLRKMTLTVVDMEVDPVSSSVRAFRLAGREAGRRLLEAIENDPYAP